MMVCDFLRLHRAERAKPDMKRHIGKVHALCLQLFQKLLREMQPSRRRGGRAVGSGIDGLIALGVLQLLMDIGRQRHLTEALENLQENALVVELYQLVAVVHLADHGCGQLVVTERQLGSGVRFSAGLCETFPDAVALVAQQQHLDRAHRRHTVSEKPCRQHARIVQHQRVSRLQIFRQIIKMPVLDFARVLAQNHQPRAVSAFKRRLGNEFFGQIIVKIMGFQQKSPRNSKETVQLSH